MSRPWNALSGALSTLLSIIETSNNLCDPNNIKGVKDLPKAFVEVAKWLPSLEKTLDNSKRRLQERRKKEEPQEVQDHYQQLTSILGGCKGTADKLKSILEEVLYVKGQSALERYQDVAEPSERVEKLMIDTLNGILELSKDPVRLVNGDEARELQKGLTELGMLPPSLVEDKSGNVFTQKGSGTMITHVGKGDVNYNNSNAPMLVGNFHDGMTFNTNNGPAPAPKAPTAPTTSTAENKKKKIF